MKKINYAEVQKKKIKDTLGSEPRSLAWESTPA